MRPLLVHSFFLAIGIAHASIAVYGPHVQQPYETATAASTSYMGGDSYDDVVLTPLLDYDNVAPDMNQPTFGPVYYSSQFLAEVSSPSGQSQVLNLEMNGDDEFIPGYAIHENGELTRVALINFVDDNTGASDYIASVSIGGTAPSQIGLRYLSASSVTRECTITSADQMSGDVFKSNGRPVAVVDVQTVNCDQTNNICNVKVPASSAALVFLSDETHVESDQGPTMTFSTIAWTKLHNTTAADSATCNGNKDIAGINSTSTLAPALPGLSAIIAVCAFVCIESSLSYAVTGRSLLASVLDMTKNAR